MKMFANLIQKHDRNKVVLPMILKANTAMKKEGTSVSLEFVVPPVQRTEQ